MQDDPTFDGLIAERLARAEVRPVLVTGDGLELLPDAFERMVGQAAAWLQRQGIGAGDVVAI